eukprot:CAMPEP_0179322156 /NCGR_PEP_ID=MMETSP0797-20121207/59017_1 /TAXON_ID=47934 /ORGANISM="Dinophysis acuminata, Strain DAEP01" /LENGTH=257 /DNA_ID=CAMNT_0021033873 /DNA_START=74 /DNA_END=844 /DNA_ORIENTATION=+
MAGGLVSRLLRRQGCPGEACLAGVPPRVDIRGEVLAPPHPDVLDQLPGAVRPLRVVEVGLVEPDRQGASAARVRPEDRRAEVHRGVGCAAALPALQRGERQERHRRLVHRGPVVDRIALGDRGRRHHARHHGDGVQQVPLVGALVDDVGDLRGDGHNPTTAQQEAVEGQVRDAGEERPGSRLVAAARPQLTIHVHRPPVHRDPLNDLPAVLTVEVRRDHPDVQPAVPGLLRVAVEDPQRRAGLAAGAPAGERGVDGA